MTDKSKDTLEFLDDLALLVDEDPHALNKHAELLADSEQYRDLRHEVRLLAEKLSDVGSDFLSPADLQTKIIETIDARAPSKPAYKPSARDAATSRETLSQGAGPVSLERSEARSGSVGSGSIKSTQTDDGNIKSSAVVTKKSTGDTPTRPRLRAAVAESRRRPAWFWTALVLAILVFVVGALYRDLWQKKTKPSSSHLVKPAPVNTLTARIAKLFCDGNAGQLGEERAAGSELRVGALFRAGEEIKTDRLSRVLLELSDGSRLILNRDTAIALSPHVERQVEMRFGELLAEIAGGSKRRGTTFSTPVGGVDVVGTKFDMSVTSTAVNVRVIRGTVTLKPSGNQQVEITAGEEGLMTKDAPARIAPLVEVARVVSWSDLQEPGTREKNRGLGELGASKPGEEGTREHPLELVKHRVTARIVGPTARTEIEETFRNDGTETLQGIYRFSLPPDARVAAISLQVDGKWQQGAVVERERAREIWRQVTRQAAPEQKRTSEEELIWAPGPWRDPALLEWQSNGRLELRIFPIPAKGEKSIRLAYTQTLAPGSSGRRYLYPLPHASGDAIKVGRFEVDIEVVGVRSENTRVYGYALRDTALAENTVLVYDQDAFSPSGDLVVEYELPDDQEEIRWWSYRGAAVAAPTKVRQSKRDEQVEREWRAIRADDRGYIALALRPDLPAWRSTRSRDYVFILDSSQSMIGERLVRSCDLAQRMISEMDREDRVLLMTCDLTCRPMAADLLSPSKETERRVKTWLAQITPAGSSDLVAAIRFAKASIEKKMQPERDVRLIYLGDGVASVGHRKTPSLVTEAKLIAADPRVTITTIGVGYDADALALTSLARAGRG
ncbi:MAG: FecR domain-containing protein, partial [Deltaproteobacteria bacterium]|nr:FecR domain-containing protein [Deltaproteobacteria bacterium]